jgi:two-component system, sensor histidine kinase and response regulator
MADKKKILLIDDDQTICEFTEAVLERTGKFEVLSTTLPAKGLQLAEDQHPDLILLDVNMPDMDGGEVSLRLSANPKTKEIPVVFLTSLLRKEEELDSQIIKDHLFIAKPVTAHELIERIEMILGRG